MLPLERCRPRETCNPSLIWWQEQIRRELRRKKVALELDRLSSGDRWKTACGGAIIVPNLLGVWVCRIPCLHTCNLASMIFSHSNVYRQILTKEGL